MATLSTAVVEDNSSLANFKAWAQIISNFMTTAGWTQSADTGQVNWSTIASVPSSAYVFEIWEPNDGLTNFYLKIEYGWSGTNVQMRLSVGTGTNGAGALSGFIAGPFTTPGTSAGSGSSNGGATQYNSYLSGAVGRIGVVMWCGNSTNQAFFVVARSKNSSGANTSTHVTLVVGGLGARLAYQTIVFGTGVTTGKTSGQTGYAPIAQTGQNSNLFGSTGVPMSPFFPVVDRYDNPLTEIAGAAINDVSDQTTFVISAANEPYGTSHTHISFKTGILLEWADDGFKNNTALVLQFE